MSISAQKNIRDSKPYYHVGNYHVTSITEEQYNEILDCIGKEAKLDEHRFIVYMHSAPKELKSKYAKLVRESVMHDKKTIESLQEEIKSLEGQISFRKSDLRAITELEEMIVQ